MANAKRSDLVRTAKLEVEVPVQNLVAACEAIQKYGAIREILRGPQKKKPLSQLLIKDPKLMEAAREIAKAEAAR